MLEIVLQMSIPLAVIFIPLALYFAQAQIAERHAQRLLRELLTAEEYAGLTRAGYLEISSPTIAGRTYRISRYGGRVQVYEDGYPICSLCVQLTRVLPPSDTLLAHKLLLESDEDRYLAIANRFTFQPCSTTSLAVPWI